MSGSNFQNLRLQIGDLRRRLAVLASLSHLALSADAGELGRFLPSMDCLPFNAARDAVHLAVAMTIASDYLLTWNYRHLANAQILKRLQREVRRAGRSLPYLCIPLGLTGDSPYEDESAP